MRVLIAEDAESLRRRMVALVAGLAGVQTVLESGDVASTLRAIDHDAPEVVVLDLLLPDGSGMEVLSALADRPAVPRVIVLTACADEAVRAACLDAGAEHFLVKGEGSLDAVSLVSDMAAAA